MFVRRAAALLVLTVCTAAAGPVSAQTPLRLTTPQAPVTSGSSPFLGGVPAGTATAEPIKLTVIDAILRALDHNLGVLTAEETLGRARGARWIALAQLLP